MITITPLRSQQAVDAVQAAAQKDNHHLIAPTHAVLKDGKVVGSISLIPTVLVWMDTKEAKVRDSMELNQFVQNHLAANGATAICMPCVKTSPYYSLMEKVGYLNLGEYNLFVKGL